jgi:hypothetical protein
MAGFHWVGSDSQGDLNGKVKMFAVAAAHAAVLGPGDVVLATGTANSAGMAEVDTGTANTANTGVVTGVPPQIATEALSQTWLSATTAGYVWVNTDPFALYAVDVANGPLAVTDVGLNTPLVATTGTVSGSLFTSNMKINATGKATTATLPFRIEGLLVGDDGVLGSRALVRVNASTSNIGATGV